MVALREYVLRVLTTAILCGIISRILGEKAFCAAAVKMICGLIMFITVLDPVVTMNFEKYFTLVDSMRSAGELAAEEGVDYAKQAVAQNIKEKTEAYILNAAKGYDISLKVEVEIAEEDIPVPESVTLIGNISPYVRRQLQNYIETQLGIPEERQIWIS